MKLKFKVGQPVVHATHGVGTIGSIETREFSPNNKRTFYIMHVPYADAFKKVFIPVDGAEERLRGIITKAVAQKVRAKLAEPFTGEVDHQTWNRRYRHYMELLHSGEIDNVVEVCRALRALRDDKDLSFGERKLLDCAEQLIEAELSAAEAS